MTVNLSYVNLPIRNKIYLVTVRGLVFWVGVYIVSRSIPTRVTRFFLIRPTWNCKYGTQHYYDHHQQHTFCKNL